MKNIDFKNLEVLSPAGNPESFLAALNNGADAIYLGLDLFNARMRAENFSRENIRSYIKLAHSYGVKVYITINTLLNDEDFDDLISLVRLLSDAKADAFIVQDFGVAYVLKKCFKNICLHASTQMGIHNLEGALVAKQIGFSRIVLSRETTLKDIEEIHKNTDLEIEYFVQGALCVAFSGNCYLSSLEHNASGNEGKCLQLCRLPYKNSETNQTKYFLSPRDLSLLENLPKLINAGVTSFKIEGRLKHSGYVGICTNLYKTALNLIKNDNFSNKFIFEANDILQTTFSRGDFNKNAYLLKNIENNIINSSFQNHIGKKIGKVKSAKSFKDNLFEITITSSHPLSVGDGLKFIDNKNNQIASIGVGDIKILGANKYKIITKHKIYSGLNVHLIQDSKIEEKFLKNTRKIALNLLISANKCEKLKIKTCLNNQEFYYESAENLESAKSSPLSVDDIKQQFSKTKDSIFEISDIQVTTNGIFAPKSILNNLRRNFLEIMQENIINENEKYLQVVFLETEYINQKMQIPNILPQNLLIIDEKHKINNDITINIISPNNYAEYLSNKSFEKITQKNIAFSLPTITNHEDKKLINQIIKKLPTSCSLFVNNIGGLYYKIFENKDIIISPMLNIKNKFSLLLLNSFGINKICASIEASESFANKYNLSTFADGFFPLMTFAHCPYKVVYENNCNNCKHSNELTYISESNKNYQIRRTKISNCYFYLMKNITRKNCKYTLKNLKYNQN